MSDIVREPIRLAHFEQLRLLGELDSIGVEVADDNEITVTLTLKGKKHTILVLDEGVSRKEVSRKEIAHLISNP